MKHDSFSLHYFQQTKNLDFRYLIRHLGHSNKRSLELAQTFTYSKIERLGYNNKTPY